MTHLLRYHRGMAHHGSWFIAVSLLLLCTAGAAFAQSHELSLRFVEFPQVPAPTTQPLPTNQNQDTGNVGQVMSLAELRASQLQPDIPKAIPAGAIVKRESKLAIEAGVPFRAEFKDGDVRWKIAGKVASPTSDESHLRATLEVQYGSNGGTESFSSNVMVEPGTDTILGGLVGANSRCWVLRISAAGVE